MNVKEELIDHYSKKSKHSNYQVMPTKLKEILDNGDIETRTRSEKERLRYMLDKIDVKGKTVLDIGGNTGFFAFEFLDAGAKKAHLYEGNKEHADFVALAARALGVENDMAVSNNYFKFDDKQTDSYNIVLLLNVLHHLGDDYGDSELSIDQAKVDIIKQLNSLSTQTETLAFQLGFNWQGDPAKPLFEHGTKQEVIEYIRSGTKDRWELLSTGVAERDGENIKYIDLNDSNIERDDSLGEFLNRPIFILRSKDI